MTSAEPLLNTGVAGIERHATPWKSIEFAGEQPLALIIYNAEMPKSISAKLADIVLPEAGGKEVHLGSLWERNPAVVVFLRHYG